MLPAWSPDKSKIAFTSDRNGRTQIYIMNSDGSGVIQLTNDDWEKGILRDSPYLIWSPDGKWVTFTASSAEKPDLLVVKPDGSDLINLTNNSASDTTFYWSPNGKRILFGSDRDGNPEIYVMNADGSGESWST